MSFCSFASLLGGACAVSSENPNVVDFFDLKDCTGNVTSADLKGCNILTGCQQRKEIITYTGRLVKVMFVLQF